jgi:hypothetical protein
MPILVFSNIIQWILFLSVVSLLLWKGYKKNSESAAIKSIIFYSLAGILIANFPIIFLGKSHVSPANGTLLLYERMPTLPGNGPDRFLPTSGSDTGATMWGFIPQTLIEKKSLTNATLPLWNRYEWCGEPLIGQGLSMIGDPLNMLTMIFGGNAIAWDIRILIAKLSLSLFLGLTVYILCSNCLAASGIAFLSAFLGYYQFRINHPAIFSLGYTAMLMCAWVYLSKCRPQRFSLAAIGILTANIFLLNSGTIKESFISILTINVIGLVHIFVIVPMGEEQRKRLMLGLLSGVSFVLITTPEWYLFLRTLGSGYTAYTEPVTWQHPLSLSIGLLDNFFLRPFARENVWMGSANLLIGLLALFELIRSIKNNEIEGRFWGVTLLLLSLVIFSLVPGFLITPLPFIGHIYHLANCLSLPFTLMLGLLAGLGIKSILIFPTNKVSSPLIIAGVGIGMMIWLAFSETFTRTSLGAFTPYAMDLKSVRYEYVIALLAAIFGLLLVIVGILSFKNRPRPFSALLFMIGCLLLCMRFMMYEGFPFGLYSFNPGDRSDLLGKSSAVEKIRQLDPDGISRAIGVGYNLFPGWNSAMFLESIGGAQPLEPSKLRELLDKSGLHGEAQNIGNEGWHKHIGPNELEKFHKLMNFLNVRYFLATPGSVTQESTCVEKIGSYDLDLYSSPSTWPRAFYSDKVDACDSVEALLSKINTPETNSPFITVDPLEHGELINQKTANFPIVQASSITNGVNNTIVKISTPGSGMVSLCETYWPDDMVTTLNGTNVPTYRVNQVYRGIVVPRAGDYVIDFSYSPKNWIVTWIISLAGCIFFILTIILIKVRNYATLKY